MGIVDDLAHEKNTFVRELLSALIGVFHRTVYAIAEAKLFGEPKCDRTDRELVPELAHMIDESAMVVRREAAFDLALESEPFPKVRLLHR